jgi:3-dehydroquinate dehydratase-2
VAKILVLHGPNLNLLGTREPQIYGTATLAEIDADLGARGKTAGHAVETFQSNAEHDLIERVHRARTDGTAFILLNAGGFTHTSVALRDAMAAAAIPFIEVHLSNIHARESFRRHSYFTDLAVGMVCGLGPIGYGLALSAAMQRLQSGD